MITLGEIKWKSNMKMEDTEMDDGRFIYMFLIAGVNRLYFP